MTFVLYFVHANFLHLMVLFRVSFLIALEIDSKVFYLIFFTILFCLKRDFKIKFFIQMILIKLELGISYWKTAIRNFLNLNFFSSFCCFFFFNFKQFTDLSGVHKMCIKQWVHVKLFQPYIWHLTTSVSVTCNKSLMSNVQLPHVQCNKFTEY